MIITFTYYPKTNDFIPATTLSRSIRRPFSDIQFITYETTTTKASWSLRVVEVEINSVKTE